MRKFLGALLLPVLILIAAACEPAIPAPPPPTPMADAGVLVVGDSITWQAEIALAAAHPDWERHTYMGWKMTEVSARIKERRDDASLGTLVVALGTNDANPTWNGGWTVADELVWIDALANLHPNTDIVLIKPKLLDCADPAHVAEVEEARAWMDLFAASDPDIYVVDWATWAFLPNVTAGDCIHLDFDGDPFYDTTPEANAARLAALESRQADLAVPEADAAVVEAVEEAVQVAG